MKRNYEAHLLIMQVEYNWFSTVVNYVLLIKSSDVKLLANWCIQKFRSDYFIEIDIISQNIDI